ncbi:MAG: S41 family peptidase [Clostridia bacterium]|nr:S41 family peptidase [Clostridia bacterium]
MEYDGKIVLIERDGRKSKKRNRVIAVALIAAVLITFLATSLYYRSKYEPLLPLAQAMKLVESNYYFYDEEENDVLTAALRGIAANIGDDYAQYFTEEEYAQHTQSNSGNYIGIGIMVMYEDAGVFRITDVFSDTPASEAGILAGDRLMAIDGVYADEDSTLTDFLNLMPNVDGAVYSLLILRDGVELTFEVEMREVYSPYVHYEMLEGNVGYILLTGFQGRCVAEMEAALEELTALGMEKLVLDLRDNLGGSLSSVVDIAGMFLDKGSVITTVRTRTDSEEVYKTDTEGMSIPIALLVNDYSASASELLAGALHDHGVARLFGITTYGKGIVQSYFELVGDNGYLKFTTDAYYTPNGVCIQGTGIEPDVVVELDEKYATTSIGLIPHEEDAQLQAALQYLMELN